MTPHYDDPEQMLQDQGLEVVVLPYRPPRDRDSGNDTTSAEYAYKTTTTRRAAGKQIDEGTTRKRINNNDNACESSCDDTLSTSSRPEFMTARHPARQLVTPRSQLAMVEAVCHDEERELLHPLHASSPKRRVDEGVSRARAAAQPRRSASTTTNTTTSSQQQQQQQGATTPPRKTQRSSTAKSSRRKSPNNNKLSYLQMVKLGYQELVHAIIRPPRSKYTVNDLGPVEFTFCDVSFTRRDFYVTNNRGMKIQCSLWSCHDWDLEVRSHDNSTTIMDQSLQRSSQYGHYRSESEEYLNNGRVIFDEWDETHERGRLYLHLNEDTRILETVDTTTTCSEEDEEGSSSQTKDKSSTVRTASLSFSQCTVSNTEEEGDTVPPKNSRKRHPVVIYMHGNSSSRLEVIPHLGHLLSLGLSVLSFDFCGSGHSDGEYVSLGYHEREDLHAIVQYLRNTNQVSSIALWGRSMGAATALMYASRDPTLACMVLDSPFTDLQRLIEEMVERGRKHGVHVPNLVLHVVMRFIKNSVKTTAGFSLRHISPISHADKCFVPAMFVAGEHDDFIHKSHSIFIHRRYAGDKNISIVDGDHNSPRPRFLQQSACLFLQSVMGLDPGEELIVPMGMNLMMPPWLAKNSRVLLQSRNGGDQRAWLPVKQERQQRKKMHHRSQSEVLEYHQDKGLHRRRQTSPNFKGTEPDEVFFDGDEEAGAVLAAAAPPDMNERQKNIQSSLFKMLGQEDNQSS